MKKLLLIIFSITLCFIYVGCEKDTKQNYFYGNIDLRTLSLAFRVSGKIKELYFDEGEVVKKGELLALLDDDLYIQELNSINSQITMQQAQVKKLENGYRKEEIQKAKAIKNKALISLKKAQKDLLRYKKLMKTQMISNQKFEDIKLIFDNAKAEYNYAKSSLQQFENGYLKEDVQIAKAQLQTLLAKKEEILIHLKDTKLYAPNDGIILTRAYEIGAIVSQGIPIFDIALNDKYWIRSYIDEKYLGLIQPNMEAKIFTDAKPNQPYLARVSFISEQAEFTPKSVQTQELRTQLVYRTRLILKNPDNKIRQGMPVTIEFENLNKK